MRSRGSQRGSALLVALLMLMAMAFCGAALVMTASGLAIGLIGAVLGNRLMQRIVFGVSPSNPGVLLTVAVLVGIVTYCVLILAFGVITPEILREILSFRRAEPPADIAP